MILEKIYPDGGIYSLDENFFVIKKLNKWHLLNGVFIETDQGNLNIYRQKDELFVRVLGISECIEKMSINMLSDLEFTLVSDGMKLRFKLPDDSSVDMFPLPNDMANWLTDIFSLEETRKWFVDRWTSIN